MGVCSDRYTSESMIMDLKPKTHMPLQEHYRVHVCRYLKLLVDGTKAPCVIGERFSVLKASGKDSNT